MHCATNCTASSGKILGNNDPNQVVASSGFSENKGLAGGSVSRAHKTWSRSFLFKDFPSSGKLAGSVVHI